MISPQKGRAERLAARVRRAFAERFGGGCRVAVAPGRVNLIGEHTDYNEGFVLPMALDRGIAVAYRPRDDGQLIIRSVATGTEAVVPLDTLRATDLGQAVWLPYVAGVVAALADAGISIEGADILIDGDVPIGAGLSSSAALEVAVARAMTDRAAAAWKPVDTARLCQRAEHAYVGVPCGIMDQMTSAAAAPDHALLLDCRSLSMRPVRLPPAVAVVVIDSGERRRLVASEYGDRRAACERAVAAIARVQPNVRALRDVSLADLERAMPALDATTVRRARHVIEENSRVLSFVTALENDDFSTAGRLLDESHASLRDLYEVSSPALDGVVGAARKHPACHGARMTGAGFGGCAIALVRRDAVDDFLERFGAGDGTARHAFMAIPSAGARIIDEPDSGTNR